MRSNAVLDRDGVLAVVERYRGAVTELVNLPLDALGVADLFAVLDATETGRCQTPVIEHQAINRIAAQATAEQIGRSLKKTLAARLRIRPGEARRRIADAEMLGARTTITGEPLPAQWPATAAAQRAGQINTAQVAEIGRFFHHLPSWVDESTRARAEADLAEQATKFGPDELRVLADKLADCLNPDGTFTDDDRARRRGITIGRQDIDGMSKITGCLTPEARASLDAVLSKWAAPAMCNPADESPTVDGRPSEQATNSDMRSPAQRNHDALAAMCRSTLASGQLGSHHGLPVSIVVTTTLWPITYTYGQYTGCNRRYLRSHQPGPEGCGSRCRPPGAGLPGACQAAGLEGRRRLRRQRRLRVQRQEATAVRGAVGRHRGRLHQGRPGVGSGQVASPPSRAGALHRRIREARRGHLHREGGELGPLDAFGPDGRPPARSRRTVRVRAQG